MALLGFLAMVISLADRINIAVAAPVLMKERGWDTVQMGWVLFGFFIGYSLLMVPVGAVGQTDTVQNGSLAFRSLGGHS